MGRSPLVHDQDTSTAKEGRMSDTARTHQDLMAELEAIGPSITAEALEAVANAFRELPSKNVSADHRRAILDALTKGEASE